jgi:hypothetical protein
MNTAASGKKTTLKVYFDEEIHRVSINDVTFVELLNTLPVLFPSFSRSSHQLKYLDEEGELITICSDVELDDALEQYGTKPLRLYVVPKDRPLNPEQLSSYLANCSSGELAETSVSQTHLSTTSELADTNDLNALEQVQKDVAGEVENLSVNFSQVRDEELKKTFLKPLIDELFKALFVVTKTLKEMFEKKWISMKEYMEARVAFFREEMRKFKLKVRELFQKLGDKLKSSSESSVNNLEDRAESLALSEIASSSLSATPQTTAVEAPVEVITETTPPVVPSPVATEQCDTAEHVGKLVQQLVDMGFTNRQQNQQLIEKHKGDLLLVINELV